MIWLYALLVSIAAGLATTVMVPLVTRLALRFDAMDHPSDRKHQQEPIPRLGGVAVVVGIGVGLGLGFALMKVWDLEVGGLPAGLLFRFSIATLAIFFLGVVDDLRGVSVFWKLVIEVLAAWMVVGGGWQINLINLPLSDAVGLVGWLAPVVSLVWIVGVTNAINLLDGLDGLAGGVVAIVSGSLMAYTLLHGDGRMVIFTSVMAGACLGFLIHNWEPAKIYLGDSGSLTLGFMLALFALQFSVKASATVTILVPILALGLPLIDTLLVMSVRFVSRRRSGGSILESSARVFKADRQHLHHVALALGARRSQIVFGLHCLVMAFCMMALWLAVSNDPWLGLGLLAIEVAAVLSIRIAGLRAQARQLAMTQRQEARVILREDIKPEPWEQADPQRLYDREPDAPYRGNKPRPATISDHG